MSSRKYPFGGKESICCCKIESEKQKLPMEPLLLAWDAAHRSATEYPKPRSFKGFGAVLWCSGKIPAPFFVFLRV